MDINKLPDGARRYLINEIEMTNNEIRISTPSEIFEEVLKYDGYGNGAYSVINTWVRWLYGVELDKISIEKHLAD